MLDECGGPVPADAGEPGFGEGTQAGRGAYPRGRGGTRTGPGVAGVMRGLSPRTRGNRGWRVALPGRQGPIPADAGEPASPNNANFRQRAYPRGRGGTGTVAAIGRP